MSDLIISYKGNDIVDMSASGTKTLLTEGKYCEDDFTITYVRPSGATSSIFAYGGLSSTDTITCVNGSISITGVWTTKTVSGESVSGWFFNNISTLGTYTITANNGSSTIVSMVSVSDVSNYNVEMKYIFVWGVDIDQSIPASASCCTYTDDAVGMTPGSSAWDTLFGCRPCLFVNGAVSCYLNPDNYAQDVDGNAVDITTVGNDVMIEFPKMGYQITTEGTTIHVKLTNATNDSDYCYKPFSRSSIGDRDYFYYGAYVAYVASSLMYSSSGKTPSGDISRADFRAYATNRGAGYFQNGWYQLLYIQVLYLLKYANLNSQAALGYGDVSGSGYKTTGTGNTLGFNYGNKTSMTDVMKLFGIENLWGNIRLWVDGLKTAAVTTTSCNIVTIYTASHFDDADSGTNHVTTTIAISYTMFEGSMVTASGTEDAGFFPKSASGSTYTTYWADYCDIESYDIPDFGADYANGTAGGLFSITVDHSTSGTEFYVGSRLMYV